MEFPLPFELGKLKKMGENKNEKKRASHSCFGAVHSGYMHIYRFLNKSSNRKMEIYKMVIVTPSFNLSFSRKSLELPKITFQVIYPRSIYNPILTFHFSAKTLNIEI